MLSLKEFLKAAELKQALGVPSDEGACFGVTEPSKLRPPFDLKKTSQETKNNR